MLHTVFFHIKSIYTYQKKYMNLLMAAGILGGAVLLCACGAREQKDQNAEFEAYTEELFCSEVSSNTINLHYTLKNPEDYGITEDAAVLGSFETDADMVKASVENMRRSLENFSYDELDLQNKITFDILDYQIKAADQSADFILYEEPLGLVSGAQTQFPVVLSEYQFYDRQDVETYLALLEMTGEYFDSLIKFEREKASAGLFMADYAPAYEKLISDLEQLRGSGKNEKGLSYLPEGIDYYELVVRQSTGSERSVEEMEDLTRRQITDDLEAMEKVLGITTEEAQEAAAAIAQTSAELILTRLQEGISGTFPEAPDTVLEVKYVPEEMEDHLSPAFYMIPAIDNTEQNVIYINQAHMSDDLTLFTTLAHEGYPGHLYQTVYYESTDPDPIRSIMDFGGYVEGWATYAEMGSYYLTPLSKEQATLLQKNSSIILGLYALADMGIHYDGWSRMDTVAFFSNYGITDAETVERIYELIIGSPGNYLKYYIGYVEFLELKKAWAEEKGEAFSQKEFHEAVLEVGPAPFEIVEEYMWEMGE